MRFDADDFQQSMNLVIDKPQSIAVNRAKINMKLEKHTFNNK